MCFISERRATSAACRKAPTLISSSVNALLNNSRPPTFWYRSLKVSGFFVCISSPKVRFWDMYGLLLFVDRVGYSEFGNFIGDEI